ncbi:MAG: hypothetical protein Q9212_005895, partial [Teloschistes hypoglaucus]
IKSKLIRA